MRSGSRIEEANYYLQDDHEPIRKLFSSNPEIRELNYRPSSRQYEALIHTLDPELYDMVYQEITESMPFKVVKGDKVFCDHLRGTQGVLVRHSDSVFIENCVKYLQSIDKKILLENFNKNRSENRVVYKSSFSYFEPIVAYFDGLLEFYIKVNDVKNMIVFVAED